MTWPGVVAARLINGVVLLDSSALVSYFYALIRVCLFFLIFFIIYSIFR